MPRIASHAYSHPASAASFMEAWRPWPEKQGHRVTGFVTPACIPNEISFEPVASN